MPIVLTQNLSNALPEFDYEDVEGVEYQYPSRYRNMIREGRRFIYYRGSRDASRKPRMPDYFGSGVIGAIKLDGALSPRDGRPLWIAQIEGYEAFDRDVEFKTARGYLEPGANRRIRAKGGHFQPGVREIGEETYRHIVGLGGGSPYQKASIEVGDTAFDDSLPPMPEGFSDLRDVLKGRPTGRGGSKGSGRRRAHPGTSKRVGTLGERTVFEYLKLKTWASNVRWLEREGERPGWDIQYSDENGEKVLVEVKASTQQTISTCELTANEWDAAVKHRSSYRLWFVTGVDFLRTPKLSQLLDPAAYVEKDESVLAPTAYRFQLRGVWSGPVE